MFTNSQRPNGSWYTHTNDKITTELKEFIRKVHYRLSDALPNDWIYEVIHEAFYVWDEYEDKDDFVYERQEDAYYSELHKWAGEPFALEFLDEVLGTWERNFNGFYDVIACAQRLAIENIRGAVREFLEENNG